MTILHSFDNDFLAGGAPSAGLVQGRDGNFYGTTVPGGTSDTSNYGTVFRISPGGSYTNLYSFAGPPNDGANPASGLVQGSAGNFYGTTSGGGAGIQCGGGCGTVFRISPSGNCTNLYSLTGSPDNGIGPTRLVQGRAGNFYGTTVGAGGVNDGTVFRISPGGSYTNLYTFTGYPTDGANPTAGLVQGRDGLFYGTTMSGGCTDCGAGTSGYGTVFRISASGSYTNLYSFAGPPNDGANPVAGLVQDSDGNFYGTTRSGGKNGAGTIFRINASGSYTNVHSFAGQPDDGFGPLAALVQARDGNFYGTTTAGGTGDAGTVFRISASGGYTNLYSFAGSPNDGANPAADLVQGSDGNLYGTTPSGGTNMSFCINGCGTVFKLTLPAATANLITFSFTNVLEKCKFKPTSTNCAVRGTLIVQSNSTNAVPPMTILLFESADSTFDALSAELQGHFTAKAIKPGKAGKPGKPLKLNLKIASDHSDSGDFIFATDANSNVLTATQIP